MHGAPDDMPLDGAWAGHRDDAQRLTRLRRLLALNRLHRRRYRRARRAGAQADAARHLRAWSEQAALLRAHLLTLGRHG